MSKAYTLTEQQGNLPRGTLVFDAKFHDYGCANDDSRRTGVEHTSVTLKHTGEYPFFTVPKHILAPHELCKVPPAEFWCSRPAGHEGPCAARPVNEQPPAVQGVTCEDCGGTGGVGELRSMGEFQPPERDECSSCGGSGRWPDAAEARRQIITGAVARGWCAAQNASKVMDTDLAEAIVGEVMALEFRPDPLMEQQMAEARAEIDRLTGLVYVPGLWSCAKCSFQLVQKNLNANTGTVTARDNPGEKCPNCNVPLWRVTERDAGRDSYRTAVRLQLAMNIAGPALERAKRLIAEALPKFNWSASALDANAIALLNEVPGEVTDAIAKAQNALGGQHDEEMGV